MVGTPTFLLQPIRMLSSRGPHHQCQEGQPVIEYPPEHLSNLCQDLTSQEEHQNGGLQMDQTKDDGCQAIVYERGIITEPFKPRSYTFQCWVCGWEYMHNGQCERCGN